MKYLHTHHGSLTPRIYEFISDLLLYTNLTQENLIERALLQLLNMIIGYFTINMVMVNLV